MYNHGEIDKKWQNRWQEGGVFKAEDFGAKPKKYLLVEFPFPSGAGLHVGHPRSYVALDVMARKYRAEGNNVLYPMGWDAFGLPTENYAIKTGRPPAEVTAENIATFKTQIQSLGLSFDWSREVNSTDPSYYKWTQWQFLQFFKAGLAYKAKTWINWCPKDKIGLANEEAAGGVCDRCGGPVEKREKEQWMISITKYADRLLSDLDQVNYLPKIRKQQEEWIGKSEGAEVEFAIEGSDKKIRVFTTRPDTLFGATYIAISAELARAWMSHGWQASEKIKNFVEQTLEDERTREATREDVTDKKGVATGIFAINPVNDEKIPVWIANYVLSGYGTGAIMAVPAHDERDFEFAEKFGLPIKQVVAPYVLNVQWMPREDRETHTRPVTSVIIRHKRTGEYLLQKMADGRCGFTGGGIEAGETAEQAMIREVAEETGFTDVKIEKVVGEFWGHGFKPKRDYNCYDPDTVFVVEVDGEPSQERTAEDLMAHEIVWKKADEVRAFINLTQHQVVWDWYQKGETYFAEEGVATTTSGFLAGLKTEEAKQKMIEWLEERKIGARKVTYKLRDWVFSRQRYWGEPIPLVHCDHCATKKQKVLLVHGYGGSAEKQWFPWMKSELEARGFEVITPTLSDSRHPDFETWMKELEPYIHQLGEDDIVVGHSLGTKAVLNAIERVGKKIGHVFLVASALGVIHERDWTAYKASAPAARDVDALQAFWNVPLNLKAVDTLIGSVQLIWSTDDELVPAVHHDVLPSGWYVNTKEGFGHFTAEQIPELRDIILTAKNTGWHALPDAQLPLTLPHVDKYEPTDTGESPLASIPEFVNTTCPRCGAPAKRETDTMPNWAGSSWYFLRYIDAHNDKEFAAADKLKYWMPVDLYNGGMEHTTLHLLYSRFWNKFMYDLGYVPTAEPYARRVSHGLIMAEDGQKMSKSKGNVVNPDEIVQAQGADTLRMYELFIGPFGEPAPWSTNGVSGVKRFLDRVMRLPGLVADTEPESVTRALHKTIKKITEDVDRMSFNTAVAQHMTFVNEVYSAGAITKETLKTYLITLQVFAPHVSEELWEQLGGDGLICQQGWPQFNHNLVVDETFELVVQVNGKVRDRIVAASSASEDELKSLALSSSKIQELLAGAHPQKVIVVKGKLVNIAL